MSTTPFSFRPLSPQRPDAARGADPEGNRPAGPTCGTRDPWVDRNLSYVARAWDRARIRYVLPAVQRHTLEGFDLVIREEIEKLLLTTDLLGALSASPLSAFGVGPRALPGTMVGAGAGLHVALEFLNRLEARFLIKDMIVHLGPVEAAFRDAVRDAWSSRGSAVQLDAAALGMAEAIGLLIGLLLQAYVAYLDEELSKVARGRLRPLLDKMSDSLLLSSNRGMREWTLRNYDRLRDRYRPGPRGSGGPHDEVMRLATSGVDAVRIRPDAPLPDVSRDYQFREYASDGKTYKQATGQLGVPGRVLTHRNKVAQRAVSEGTGDDAGHLIGDRFGAPGGPENLSPQNWISNQYGTYKELENVWAEKLRSGTDITVTVTDVTRGSEDRPFMREVRWTELGADGRYTSLDLTFANTQTPKSREARGVEPTSGVPEEGGKVIEVDFPNKTRLT